MPTTARANTRPGPKIPCLSPGRLLALTGRLRDGLERTERGLLASLADERIRTPDLKCSGVAPDGLRRVGGATGARQRAQHRVAQRLIARLDAGTRNQHQSCEPVLVLLLEELIVERAAAELVGQHFLENPDHVAADERHAFPGECA